MTTLNEYVRGQLEDPDFAGLWADDEGEYQAMKALVLARTEAGLSQRELSQASGVPQKTISLIETADTNPTVKTLSKLAKGMGKVLTIGFAEPDQAVAAEA